MDFWNLHLAHDLYKPLEGTLPLRVLQLHPGPVSAPIKCELIVTQLEQIENEYEATSYTWGSPADPLLIECNGLAMRIQRNAFDMLAHIRHPDWPRVVWIDAVCINQSDIEERSQQVSMMHQIYSSAVSVVVWLGPAADNSHLAVEFAASLDPARYIDELGAVMKFGNSVAARDAFRDKTYFFGAEPASAYDRELAVALVAFINRPWFNRVWVQQEATACRDTRVLCGPDTVSWDHVFALAWILMPIHTASWPDYFPHSYRESQSNLVSIRSIQSSRWIRFRRSDEGVHGMTVLSLAAVLLKGNSYAATDPRDKIFALRNVCHGNFNRWAPEADYRIPWEILYIETSLSLLTNGWLPSLSRAGRSRHPPDSVLPSWVQDYRRLDASVLQSNPELIDHFEWAAGGFSPDSTGVTPVLTIAARKRELPKHHRRKLDQKRISDTLQSFKGRTKQLLQSYISIRCLMMDEIVYVGQTVYDHIQEGGEAPSLDRPSFKHCLDCIRHDLDHLDTRLSGTYMNGDSVLEAYRLTLITATGRHGELVGAEYTRDHWDSWVRWLTSDDDNDDINDVDHNNTAQNPAMPLLADAFLNSGALFNFRFATTKHSYLCLVPAMVQVHDVAAIIKGCTLPVVLRPWTPPTTPSAKSATATNNSTSKKTDDGYFELIGDAYVHGMMVNQVACINTELGCKASPTPAQREKVMQAAQRNNGEVWDELGLGGNYTEVLDTIGMRWVDLV
ncbi:heterokaryon incompatibility protein-domain-containing protein [Lasiosphaeria miniovina]|uniref:Heterokaryon incompatibility protein-domain-containing protein n=1 Tax=Lasiosphaeria miniovina TaxID=1954250 RepID=A0AA40DQV6_9PEZI|nr:heterokaryon incompatibility protein-domain-containing protein [Lasiosphaeria miniovina]KAK0710136.1 heterokaryon incompatibility protein-domain-containing protein [Lasiosphaeria miniovina]